MMIDGGCYGFFGPRCASSGFGCYHHILIVGGVGYFGRCVTMLLLGWWCSGLGAAWF
ncbi:hypothetical protein SLEP1_g33223 [Rubroshorea leprosula]|uniref:Uncharacterized protein n=1 Tax=Rubroshorea leprosula TaxID=152421 RepID=A0AAV5KG40_9ROSI|nr:hypothetical protein SLEP1_g33223 [Rubroshorea leprosula]